MLTLAATLERTFSRHTMLTGRGTAALWVILRAVALRNGTGNIILPGLLCPVVLDAILLAGFTPRLADIQPGRFTLSPESVAALVDHDTRAVLVAHTFGHSADINAIRAVVCRHAPHAVLIEDAVQGIGGTTPDDQRIGMLGDLSFLSFHWTKTLQGAAGAALWDDLAWAPFLEQANCDLSDPSDSVPDPAVLCELTSVSRAESYLHGLRGRRDLLLTPYPADDSAEQRMCAAVRSLPETASSANIRAKELAGAWQSVQDAAFALPAIQPGDSLWRYALVARNPLLARRSARALQTAALPGATGYVPYSAFFSTSPEYVPAYAHSLAGRLLNLFLTDDLPSDYAQRVVQTLVAVIGKTIGR